jgi:hypothetical protein
MELVSRDDMRLYMSTHQAEGIHLDPTSTLLSVDCGEPPSSLDIYMLAWHKRMYVCTYDPY